MIDLSEPESVGTVRPERASAKRTDVVRSRRCKSIEALSACLAERNTLTLVTPQLQEFTH